MTNNKFYVTMNDSFTSSLRTDGKIDKIIIECDTLEETETVMENAKNRTDMKYINYHYMKYPYYNQKKFVVQVHDKNDYKAWFKEGFFKNER